MNNNNNVSRYNIIIMYRSRYRVSYLSPLPKTHLSVEIITASKPGLGNVCAGHGCSRTEESDTRTCHDKCAKNYRIDWKSRKQWSIVIG